MTVMVMALGELDTNCYVVWADPTRALVIDPADQPERILAVIESKGLAVQAVVLTHVHFDHFLAAQAVCKATGAPLYVGAGDEEALSDPARNLSTWLSAGKAITFTADKLLKEGDALDLGGETLRVWETPGHTPGCICLVGDSVVFSGDTLFCGSIGRTDFPGGDVPAMLASLKRLTALPDNITVYSGHGPATNIGREKTTNPYLG